MEITARKFFMDTLRQVSVPAVYELFINNKTPTPCVSYLGFNDTNMFTGETLTLDSVSFLVKIYAKSVDEIETINLELTNLFKDSGFNRSGGDEFLLGDIIVKNYTYTGTYQTIK